MKNKILIFLTVLCFALTASAQKGNVINGKVVDADNIPLPGVSVTIKGENKVTTVTKPDGSFQINVVNPKGSLVFSFVGMKTQEVALNGRRTINVTLEEDAQMLDEVVAIGFATMSRKDVTGSVSSVSSKELADFPVTTAAEALKGKVPGVVITSASGSQEAEVFVRVRGGISVTQDNTPLYIVDGIPQKDGLSQLNPNDIETIDILKDAASTAIYGASGANGVILVTTKKGKSGRCLVSYDTYWSFGVSGKKIPVLSPKDFVIYDYERQGSVSTGWTERYGAFQDINANYDGRPGVDWQEVVYGGTAISQMQRVTATGGTETARYNVSYTFNDDGNMIPFSGMNTHNFRARVDSKINSALSIGAFASYNKSTTRGVGAYQENGAKMSSLIEYRPTVGIKGDDSELLNYDEPYIDEEDNLSVNPYLYLKTQTRTTQRSKMNLGGNLSWTILKNLTYAAQFSYTLTGMERSNFFTALSSQAQLNGGPYGDVTQTGQESIYASHTLQWSQSWNKVAKLTALVGQDMNIDSSKSLTAGSTQFPQENFGVDDFSLGAVPNKPSSDRQRSTSASFFGRANVSLLDRYMISGTLRADGSSKFGVNNRWGYFPSVAVAWRASEESFIRQLDIFSNLKVRLSYGLAGNNRIENYLSSRMYNPAWTPINNVAATTFSSTLGNPDLKWETNSTTNLGFDFGFFNNRFSSTIELYNVHTTDLLLNANLPYTSGYATCMRNVGSTQSRGLEIGITSVNINSKNWNWTTNFNIAFNRTKVLKLADSDRWEVQSNSGGLETSDFLIEVGKPTGMMYGYVSDGLYQANEFNFVNGKWALKDGVIKSKVGGDPMPGYKKYKNLNPEEDNLVDENDMTIIGNANPEFTGGMLNSVRYRNLDFSCFFEYSVGGDIYNANIYRYLRAGKGKNTVQYVYDAHYRTIDDQGNYLLTTGDIETLDRINQGKTFPSQQGSYIPFDSSMVEDGSYLRLSNITLGYTFPTSLTRRFRVEKLRFYGTVSNLFVWTKYSGFDPEVSMNRNNGLTPGIDRGSSPRGRNFVIGANLSF